ncbi:MAG: prolyl oligopeptidase family serine peptidase [Brevundimonas sp.]|uniref:alpha/beta hydrolase family protein n=1 Tax=Brevundimonas sp. TaxID=1871086 RepID=UPI00256356FE|nr:prolyl oligopeptidase family serine peptidase [Brevundimonas sp.]MDK2747835.1 prolyl oligopeptidase family serine peptidase [Brevundimonas sp.]
MILLAALAALALQTPPSAAVPSAPPATTPAAQPAPQTVGFTRLEVADGAGPAIEVGIWTPPSNGTGDDARRPLIVISHGNGGDFRSHEATARALAQAGFTVAALTHTGDNWRDQSQAANVAQRPRQIHVLIDYLTGQWDGRGRIDPDRIGAFGFSSGGFSVLTAAGGKPDLSRVVDHCRPHPDFYDCRLVSAHPEAIQAAAVQDWIHDARIKAVVAAAPALGFTFTREGLSGLTQPVQLWRAEDDHVLPSPFYAEPVRDALPRPPEYRVVSGADHFDFLPPCSARLAAAAPIICVATPGFDRAAFQEGFNREIIRFFSQALSPTAGPAEDL